MHEIVMEISIWTFLFLNKSLVLFSGMAWRENSQKSQWLLVSLLHQPNSGEMQILIKSLPTKAEKTPMKSAMSLMSKQSGIAGH